MIKKILIAVLVLIIAASVALFIYRYKIVQYSAESIIKNALPDYVKIDTLEIVPADQKIIVKGFRILNPPGFSSDYLMEIPEVSCKYKMKGKVILDGLEIYEPSLNKPVLNIERLRDGSLNLAKMQEKAGKGISGKTGSGGKAVLMPSFPGNKKISELIKLPEIFSLKDGRIIFIDQFQFSKPYTITFDNVNSTLGLKLNDMYSSVLKVSSKGQGNLNQDPEESIAWDVSLDPTTPKLTMGSRFEVSNLSILTFEPYYDKYSPFIFKKGIFSGTLIFDFDNGEIGSSDEIHLADFRFSVKRGYENASFWDTTVPDLVKYFTTSSGEIVFDFKIKGDMSQPKFYLGPISKQALTAMAIDKISSAIEKASGPKGAAGAGGSTDMDKAQQYINVFKELIKKK